MLNELDKLILFIQEKYIEMLDKWIKDDKYEKIDLKKTEVREINENNKVLDTIYNYRSFINKNNLALKIEMNELDLKSDLDVRVKARNSIEYKIINYIKNHKEGKIPINKCFNDIYGIRITFEDDVHYEKIKNFIDNKYNEKIKCIDSTKPEAGYLATHIYFKKGKYSFPWELQIWDKKHKRSNIRAHEIYKQDYVKWEKEVRGGM